MLCLSKKIQVYSAVVISTLLYDVETWVLYTKSRLGYSSGFTNAPCIPPFASNGKTVSNEEVLKRACLPSKGSILLQVQLHLAGHTTRMKDMLMPKAVPFGELQDRKHECGAPRKRFEDQLKRQLSRAGIGHQSWQQEAPDQDSWHSSVRKASHKFKAERHEAAKERCRRQKEPAASLSSSNLCPNLPKPSPVQVQQVVLIKKGTLQQPASLQKLTIKLPQNPHL